MRRHALILLRSAILTIILLNIVLPLQGDIVLENFLETQGLELYWDAYVPRGIIWRGDRMISFIPGFPLVMHDLQSYHQVDPPYYSGGSILIPDETAQQFAAFFGPDEPLFGRQVSTIFIDPGHGGRDPGTIGTLADGSSLYEKHIVLQIALNLAARLRAQYPDKRIILSRESDVFLSLEERTELANSLSSGPDEKIVFISIHANAALNRRVRGTEVWYLPPEYRRQLLGPEDVESENSEVLPILNSILEEEYTVESIILARNIDQGLQVQVGDVSPSRGLKEMDWYVVRKAHMPSVLVEVGFVTHKDEVELLNDPGYLQKLTLGIYNGITNFIQDFESVSQ